MYRILLLVFSLQYFIAYAQEPQKTNTDKSVIVKPLCSKLSNAGSPRLDSLENIYVAIAQQDFCNGSDSLLWVNWQKFLTTFHGYVKSQGFEWQDTVFIFNRWYFNEAGEAEYVFFAPQGDVLSHAEEELVADLYSSFVATKPNFGFKCEKPFVQCGTVGFASKKEKEETPDQ